MIALWISGCSGSETSEAGDIAAAYAEEHWPGSTMGPDGNVMAPEVVDEGDHWKVSFRLPPGWSGGTPRLKIRKSDQTVFDPEPGQ